MADDDIDYGELEDFRELVERRGDDIDLITFLDLGDGDGFANVEVDGKWYGFDFEDFDPELWEELFQFIEQYDIDFDIYEGA